MSNFPILTMLNLIELLKHRIINNEIAPDDLITFFEKMGSLMELAEEKILSLADLKPAEAPANTVWYVEQLFFRTHRNDSRLKAWEILKYLLPIESLLRLLDVAIMEGDGFVAEKIAEHIIAVRDKSLVKFTIEMLPSEPHELSSRIKSMFTKGTVGTII